jgi:hypothetical protein
VTASRVASGECYVVLSSGTLAGTVVLNHPEEHAGTPWFAKPDVASAHQLAVEPRLQ